jgi:mRNA interferase MazF
MPTTKHPSPKNSPTPLRGEIWLINFDPTQGDEMRKQRPAVVLGTQASGLNLSIVVPLTTWRPDFMQVWHIIEVASKLGSGLTAESGASCYHVRSVSHGRFMKKIGAVSSEELEEITACVQNCVEL